MKTKISLLFLLLCFTCGKLFSQVELGRCGAAEIFEEALKRNPSYAANQRNLESFTEHYSTQYLSERTASGAAKKQAVIRIIPVVVHVIHTGGIENISKAQILSQIDVLNRDFRRLNADTGNTPQPFKSLAGDSEIEFRMAQLDPNGNCTDGIVRVFSPLTNNADDAVKALSYWPSNKYLNIWIVKSTLIMRVGYAQFPGGPALTDGIVVMAEYYGNIGTAVVGETAVHEAGHWLNLRHIWGDDSGACTGTDLVSDTPNQSGDNTFLCPTFPLLDACTPSGNGVMYCNYMDYTSQLCQNMFSVGQAARMNAALSSSTSGRNNLWTTSNLALTGVSQPISLCKADFSVNVPNNSVCENGIVTYADVSYNGSITSRTWAFSGGTLVPPSTLNDSIVNVTYTTAGNYDVSLTVGNGVNSVNSTQPAFMHVWSNLATYNSTVYTEGFENAALPSSDWDVSSPDGGSTTWTQNSTVGFSGNASAFIANFNVNTLDLDELIGPTFNAQSIFGQTSPGNLNFSFQCAFAKRTASDIDALKVLVSTDCGRTWTPRLTLTATSLSSVTGLKTSYFVPTSTEWKKQTVSINNVTNAQNVRIKFQFTGGGGNNIYIDDINISNLALGIEENFFSAAHLSIFPNPSKGETLLNFMSKEKGTASIRITDCVGKEIETLFSGEIEARTYKFKINSEKRMAAGLYFITATVNGASVVKKLVLE